MPHRHPMRVITTATRLILQMLMPMTRWLQPIPIAAQKPRHPVSITARISIATTTTISTFLNLLSSRVFRCVSMRAAMRQTALRKSACRSHGMAAQRGQQPGPRLGWVQLKPRISSGVYLIHGDARGYPATSAMPTSVCGSLTWQVICAVISSLIT